MKKKVKISLEQNSGILRLKPAWVARAYLKPGMRLGLPDDAYNVGERGFICERWLASETEASNAIKTQHEGLSSVIVGDQEYLLRDLITECGDLVMGADYWMQNNKTLGRLAKIFDYSTRLFFHFHQRKEHARLVGRNPKEEAYYFPPNVNLGPHPETFFGVHPFLSKNKKYEEVFIPYLEEWKGEDILKTSKGYRQFGNDGFHVPAGILHAPGTALTIELQEPSDVMAVLQAEVEGFSITKELLFKPNLHRVDGKHRFSA